MRRVNYEYIIRMKRFNYAERKRHIFENADNLAWNRVNTEKMPETISEDPYLILVLE